MDESHIFYKKVPPGFFGSKKPPSAEKVYLLPSHTSETSDTTGTPSVLILISGRTLVDLFGTFQSA